MTFWASRRSDRKVQDVGVARRSNGQVNVTPRLSALDEYAGMWVAVRDSTVVAAAKTSRELAYELHKLGPKARGAVTKYVGEPSDAVMVGLG